MLSYSLTSSTLNQNFIKPLITLTEPLVELSKPIVKFADFNFDSGCYYSKQKESYIAILCHTPQKSVFKVLNLATPSVHISGSSYIDGVESKGTHEMLLVQDLNFAIGEVFDFLVVPSLRQILLLFTEKMSIQNRFIVGFMIFKYGEDSRKTIIERFMFRAKSLAANFEDNYIFKPRELMMSYDHTSDAILNHIRFYVTYEFPEEGKKLRYLFSPGKLSFKKSNL